MRDRLEETEDYPRMFVCDGRVTGSITLGRTRLPLWAVNAELVAHGWEAAADQYYPDPDDPARESYPTQQETSDFFYHLLEQRGEFGRLLCVLADEDRRDLARRRGRGETWWMQMPRRRARVRAALQACIDQIDAAGRGEPDA